MNTVKYFIGIVPSNDIYQEVQNIQKRFGDNRLEPHITIRPPVTPTDPVAWLQAIETVCLHLTPISIALPATGKFAKRVLFIQADSSSLEILHNTITAATRPFEPVDPRRQQEHGFTAHLTLGRSWCSFSPQDFSTMQEITDTYLSTQPVSFEAHSIRVYHKPSHLARYTTLKDVLLGH